MAPRDWPGWLQDLKPDVDATHRDRMAFTQRFTERFGRERPAPESEVEAFYRLRGIAAEAVRVWSPGRQPQLDQFLELAIVDAHDAAVDAMACIASGYGAPAIALLRRQYELTLLLVAGWENPERLATEMERALRKPYTDDAHAELAARGMFGAVMPSAAVLRDLGLGESSKLDDIEKVVKSVSHGGLYAGGFYLSANRERLLDLRVEDAMQFSQVAHASVGLSSVSAAMIGKRLGYQLVYRDVEPIFGVEAVQQRDDHATSMIDNVFPQVLDMIWSANVGIGSISLSFGEAIGKRPYDLLRRQAMVIVDAFETVWEATELFMRGRLAGSATLIRRLFELSLELQSWAQVPDAMANRFKKTGGESTPPTTVLIRLIHGAKSGPLQRRTYSTLCSAAHGGAQAQAYLLGLHPIRGIVVTPAPTFAYTHHRWLLGTLISALDAVLGAALIIAGRVDSDIGRSHALHLHMFRNAYHTLDLGLIPNKDLDEGIVT
ncbi:MAG: hypothetical protein KGK07_03150 [Chloroflexota bacterium]|nr:hypothetical protein [Chloroflexota bacterium]